MTTATCCTYEASTPLWCLKGKTLLFQKEALGIKQSLRHTNQSRMKRKRLPLKRRLNPVYVGGLS